MEKLGFNFLRSWFFTETLLGDWSLNGMFHVFIDGIHERVMGEGHLSRLHWSIALLTLTTTILSKCYYLSLGWHNNFVIFWFGQHDFLLIIIKSLLPWCRYLRLICVGATPKMLLFLNYSGASQTNHFPVRCYIVKYKSLFSAKRAHSSL
jgi:hypothetical protein